MKKAIGIIILGLLWCNVSFSKEINIKGYLSGMESDNEQIHTYIKGNLFGIYSGFMMSNVELNQNPFCVPDNLYINAENLIKFMDDEIKYAKKICYYDVNDPIAFYLMMHLKRIFPCN